MRSTDAIGGYHAHVYYDEHSKPAAAMLREAIESTFDLTVGRWHDKPVGPHPCWSYQITFPNELFATIVPWLSLNRQGLNILVHPQSGDDLADHTDHAMWLGDSQALRVEMFKT
ncbi:MAG: DOPA 4,5-dioxygenase family protein [Pseudomonadota bacterium]